ncbi:MAG: hypothetical protein KKB50_21900 [Planctomycetes bacterium]|nr:hypothetical protein [Planctomycetota bacterium]
MVHRLTGMVALVACVGFLVGCSGSGAAMTGGRMGFNLMKKDSYLKIWLDGEQGKQNKVKKAATGYSRWTIKEPTSTGPKLQFEIESPDRFGRITMVSLQIHQKFEADYSDHAEFIVVAKDTNNPQAQMKPGVEYDLGAPGEEFKVFNYKSEEVSGVELKPGVKYMLVLTVKADKSETAQIFFETK